MKFWKIHGTGNDFILMDNRDSSIENLPGLSRFVCHRRFGIGADGLILAQLSDKSDIAMIYFNSDGSPATMCGNGLRSFAKFVRDLGIVTKDMFTVETGDGIKSVSIKEEGVAETIVELEMGIPSGLKDIELRADNLTFNSIFMHMGVPHTVIFPDKNIDLLNITEKIGPIIEKDTLFKEGTNVNFVHLNKDKGLVLSTWERGAGRTWACGTGACASAMAAYYLGLTPSSIDVKMPGGIVKVSISDNRDIILEGPARLICKGTIPKQVLLL